MLSISQTERFNEDIKKYKAAIDKVNDSQKNAELTTLVTELIQEVKSIDQYYEGLLTGNGMPSRVDDSRSSILSIRKELDRRLSLKY